MRAESGSSVLLYVYRISNLFLRQYRLIKEAMSGGSTTALVFDYSLASSPHTSRLYLITVILNTILEVK